ncbi:hypothetical protein Pmani_023602 [Petrolisthes manimaculis]|uniref:Uncharacterized protein n=2 Tax=Petrolisthes manimaculis TaxID=1843537 RepID=A0AAE1PC27_9EUCA|nr:hypothetical protein Pmani_023602 [Petrolisthes manimaculis]
MTDSTVLSVSKVTDWQKCCLCQTIKGEELKSPPSRYKVTEDRDGYAMIARNVPLFKEINKSPIILDPKRLDDGDGITETLRKNKAVYHQSCRLLFSNSKLERANKRSAGSSKNVEIPEKCRRSSLESEVCFLCEKKAPSHDLRHAMTLELDKRLNECARTLNDGRLLAILSVGDAVAQELQYHRACLTKLYNRERSMMRKENMESLPNKDKDKYLQVFSELLLYITETNSSTNDPVVFRLADLVSLYQQRLKQLGIHNPNVNSTRLKDQLLSEIPELEAHKKGRDVLLAYTEDVGSVLSTAVDYTEAIIITKAAKILRQRMIDHKSVFAGTFDDNCVEDSVPQVLLQFVSMIEHGADIKSQLRFGASKTDFALSQLLQYNCYSKYQDGGKLLRHSKDHETPFPIFLGLSVYSKTRKKHLVELLHEHGLSISYDRVLEVSAQLGDAAVGKYKVEGVVCPKILRKSLFTTSAMDNIDHNPTATTATSSFHGTSISIFQHPSTDHEGTLQERCQIDTKVKTISKLPESYTNVPPAFFGKKNPKPPHVKSPPLLPSLDLEPEFEWLQKVHLSDMVSTERVDISWAAHHASMKRSPSFEVTITSLLPLLREQAHSVATICHCLDKIKEVVSHLNPGQVPVVAADQPIFATAKQVQWHWPDKYGEDKFVIMFGGLHIEMAALKSLGTLLQDSGWTTALTESGIATTGTADSFLSASSVTRTRQMHQVTASSLYKLLTESYEAYVIDVRTDDKQEHSFEDWCNMRKTQSPQFQYWYMIFEMELAILALIRSFREANFDLYCQALQKLIPFFFANNNTNYARWLPIHLRDMLHLGGTHPQIKSEFSKGNFVVHKSKRRFSALAIDQAHEHANAVIKGEGGAIGITEDPSALRRWMVAGPEISHLVNMYEKISEKKEANEEEKHLEQNAHAQKTFLDRVSKLYTTIKEMDNPFMEESKDLLTIDTKQVAHSSVAERLATHYDKGKERFDDFIDSLSPGSESKFYDPIKKQKLGFFSQKPDETSTDMKQKIMKDDCALFSKLFISCQARECDLNDFFKHENQPFPAALSDGGRLHACQKAQLANILEDTATHSEKCPEVEAFCIDGSALVNATTPRISKTFDEYAELEVLPKIQSYSSKYARTDIVFDVYKPLSLKAESRSKRGCGTRQRVTGRGKVPKNWQSFMRDSSNKTELFEFLADKIVENCTDNIVYVTRGKNVVCNQMVNLGYLSPCNHEEADTRIFVHVKHSTEEGKKHVLIKANDTDIFVIAVNVFSNLKELGLQELWIEFGQGKNVRWIPVHDVSSSITQEKSEGILFFHAFSGCDNVSSFKGKGKKSLWQTWDVCPDVSQVFKKLSKYPPVVDEMDIQIIEMYVVSLYDRSSTVTSVNNARFDMFARKQRSFDAIPPTRSALVEHIRRASYQAGCIWAQSLACTMEETNPSDWGWKLTNNVWSVVWSTRPQIADSCKELTKCGCRQECRGRCKCYKLSLPCTALCSCICHS